VILVDANLLIYAHVTSFEQHEAARGWLDRQLNGTAPVGLPWVSILAFLRLVTNRRLFAQPEPVRDAWRQASSWLACEVVWSPAASDRHKDILGALLEGPGISANLVPDAHLAALAIEHGLVLCSTDGDFARFPDLRWQNPLLT
jgi:toxin-antitoxin system PIN domain toxin